MTALLDEPIGVLRAPISADPGLVTFAPATSSTRRPGPEREGRPDGGRLDDSGTL